MKRKLMGLITALVLFVPLLAVMPQFAKPAGATTSTPFYGWEDGTVAGWTVLTGATSTLANTSSQSHSGTHALDMNVTDASFTAGSNNTPSSGVAVTAGTVFQLSAWFKAGATARGIGLGVNWYNSSGTFLSNSLLNNVTDSTSAWTQSVGSVTAPANAAFAIQLVLVSGATSEHHYVDDLNLSITGAGYGWEDGYTDGWTGTSPTVTTAAAHTGTQSLSTTGALALVRSGDVNHATQGIPVAASTTYPLTGWFKTATGSRNVTLGIYWVDSSGNNITPNSNLSAVSATTGSFTEASGTVTSPSNAAYALIQVTGGTGSNTIYIDDVGFTTDNITVFSGSSQYLDCHVFQSGTNSCSGNGGGGQPNAQPEWTNSPSNSWVHGLDQFPTLLSSISANATITSASMTYTGTYTFVSPTSTDNIDLLYDGNAPNSWTQSTLSATNPTLGTVEEGHANSGTSGSTNTLVYNSTALGVMFQNFVTQQDSGGVILKYDNENNGGSSSYQEFAESLWPLTIITWNTTAANPQSTAPMSASTDYTTCQQTGIGSTSATCSITPNAYAATAQYLIGTGGGDNRGVYSLKTLLTNVPFNSTITSASFSITGTYTDAGHSGQNYVDLSDTGYSGDTGWTSSTITATNPAVTETLQQQACCTTSGNTYTLTWNNASLLNAIQAFVTNQDANPTLVTHWDNETSGSSGNGQTFAPTGYPTLTVGYDTTAVNQPSEGNALSDVTDTAAGVGKACVDSSGGQTSDCFTDGEVFDRRSTNGGLTWTATDLSYTGYHIAACALPNGDLWIANLNTLSGNQTLQVKYYRGGTLQSTSFSLTGSTGTPSFTFSGGTHIDANCTANSSGANQGVVFVVTNVAINSTSCNVNTTGCTYTAQFNDDGVHTATLNLEQQGGYTTQSAVSSCTIGHTNDYLAFIQGNPATIDVTQLEGGIGSSGEVNGTVGGYGWTLTAPSDGTATPSSVKAYCTYRSASVVVTMSNGDQWEKDIQDDLTYIQEPDGVGGEVCQDTPVWCSNALENNSWTDWYQLTTAPSTPSASEIRVFGNSGGDRLECYGTPTVQKRSILNTAYMLPRIQWACRNNSQLGKLVSPQNIVFDLDTIDLNDNGNNGFYRIQLGQGSPTGYQRTSSGAITPYSTEADKALCHVNHEYQVFVKVEILWGSGITPAESIVGDWSDVVTPTSC